MSLFSQICVLVIYMETIMIAFSNTCTLKPFLKSLRFQATKTLCKQLCFNFFVENCCKWRIIYSAFSNLSKISTKRVRWTRVIYRLVSNPEMDLSVAREPDSINALCSQINNSFTNPSEDLCAKATNNCSPACSAPPAIPPPPAPLQGKTNHILKSFKTVFLS